MTNLKRYTMVIRRDSEGFATPALKVRQEGDVLKYEEVKDLLDTPEKELILYCRCGGELKEYLTSFICRKCHVYYPITRNLHLLPKDN